MLVDFVMTYLWLCPFVFDLQIKVETCKGQADSFSPTPESTQDQIY